MLNRSIANANTSAGTRVVELTTVMALGAGFTWSIAGGATGLSIATLWFAIAVTGVLCVRACAAAVATTFHRTSYMKRTAIVYGGAGHGETLVRALAEDPTADVTVCGLFDDRSDERAAATTADVPHLGDIDALKAYVRMHAVDVVILALPMAAEERVTMLVKRLSDLPVDVRLAATASKLQLAPGAYSYVGSVPMIDLADRPIAGWNAIAKRVLDLVIALAALVILAPVMALVALFVRLESKGPALFRQKRYGFNNELIEVYKFRSMYADRADVNAQTLVTKQDPRVTRVGRVIRKTSLDELPQLFNVLAGNLSLVGPRPHAVQAKAAGQLYPEVVDAYFARHNVKPGMTGWAQVNGWRGETDTEEKIRQRVAYDLDYIKRWSIAFDIAIIAKTPGSLIAARNAY